MKRRKKDKPFGYCPQESWIFVGSIRENILIGREFNKKKYSEVIKVCCLEPDFENFQDKDQTIVGEKGVTLSQVEIQKVEILNFRNLSVKILSCYMIHVPTK